MKERFLEEVLKHQALVHKICKMYRDTREDREDLFQEITYQLWRAYPKFQGRSKISTWMYRIGLNTAMASFRKPKIAHSQVPIDLERMNRSEDAAEDDNSEKLHWAIQQMNKRDKALIALYLDDLSYQEMAEIMGISENYIGVRLNRIKEKIKKLLTP